MSLVSSDRGEAMAVEEEKTGVIRRGFEGPRFEQSPKWIRVRLGGSFIADSKRVQILFDPKRLPVYYFPTDDVVEGALETSGRADATDRGDRVYYDVVMGDRRARDGAWGFPEPTQPFSFLKGFVAFRWDAMDGWFEEDDEVFVHAKDPYHRIDVLRSTRHVRIEHAGVVLADSTRPVVLFETGLPPRFYLPKTDVRMDLLEPSSTLTKCPYKGEADHWSLRLDETLHEDIAWTYRLPSVEVSRIENLVCFYQERIDSVTVDGRKLESVQTPWSRRENV
jgi:uncharacterized protein (DUF427 family)